MNRKLRPFTARSEQESTLLATDTRSRSPEDTIRSILANAIAPATLPPTKHLELHYIRGLNPETQVLFTPEFLYLLDAGLPSIAGVSIRYIIDGMGDPTFPEFNDIRLLSVRDWDPNAILFPATAGKLLITVVAGTTPTEVSEGLKDYTKSVHQISANLYAADVIPFSEQQIATTIVDHVAFVRFAELDFIVRLDDGIRWQEDRVI